ncbi:unnamed protein product [Mytilus edulis]|uniref:Uncharacterized protein n=1 Tax=Mytilus edulis TaxID=6550 RepID=A0A8S3VJP1_MYTED|nr:unnamed protein product [Mytilus edulis]
MQNIKWIIALLVIIILLLFTFHYSVLESTTTTTMEYPENDHIPLGIINQIVNQRNLLSQQLNEARKTIGQLQCEKSDQKTNSQGGWCKQASTETGGEHMTDMTLVKALAYFLKIKALAASVTVLVHTREKFLNLGSHAKEGIILSWAVPGQGGLSHINNQPLQHVVDVMEKNGFTIDQSISKVLQDSAELPWIKSNFEIQNSDIIKHVGQYRNIKQNL